MEDKLWNEIVRLFQTKGWIVFILFLVGILVWEVLKSVFPKLLSSIYSKIRANIVKSRQEAREETKIRNFIVAMHRPNWVSCIPSVSEFQTDAPIDVIYYPLRYKFVSSGTEYNEIDIGRILVERLVFAVVGGPGSGKSSVLNMLAIAYANDTVQEVFSIVDIRLPLLLQMKNIDADKTLIQSLSAYYNVSETFIERQLNKKRCIVLFDGLDEVPTDQDRRRLINWVTVNIARYEGNRFVISCRTLEWANIQFPGIGVARILNLSSDEAEHIIRKWHLHLPEKILPVNKQSLIGLLHRHDPSLKSFFSNPLLLTILIILDVNNILIPDGKTNIYSIILKIILGEWNDMKNLDSPEILGTTIETSTALKKVCLFMQQNKKFSGTIDLADSDTNIAVENILNSVYRKEIQPEFWFDKLAHHSTIVTKIDDAEYDLGIRGFFEFLSAQELYATNQHELVREQFDNLDWRETIILYFLHFTKPFDVLQREFASVDGYSSYFPILSNIGANLPITHPDRRRISEKLDNYLSEQLLNTSIPDEVFVQAFTLNPEYWLIFFKNTIQSKNDSNSIRRSVELLCVMNTDSSIDLLKTLVSTKPSLSNLIVTYLRYSTIHTSNQYLWSLVEAGNLLASESLVYKSGSIVEECREKITGEYPTEIKIVAARALMSLKSPSLTAFLIQNLNNLSPKVTNYIGKHLDYDGFFGAKHRLNGFIKWPSNRKTKFGYLNIKRGLDVCFAIFFFLLLIPVFLILALIIWLDNRGPIIIKIKRVGADKKEFILYKFRTMRYERRNYSDMTLSSRNDARITRFGRFLRKSGLDILPGIYNIIKGDISFVGPRYQQPKWEKDFPFPSVPLKSGLTGLAQIRVRGEYKTMANVYQSYSYDLEYFSKVSFTYDVRIFFASIANLAKGEKNAF